MAMPPPASPPPWPPLSKRGCFSGPTDYAPQHGRTAEGNGGEGLESERPSQSEAPAGGHLRPAVQSEPSHVTGQNGGPHGRRVTKPSDSTSELLAGPGARKDPERGGLSRLTGAAASKREAPIKQIKMAGKEFLDHPVEKKFNHSRKIPEAKWQMMLERLPQRDQNFFLNGSLALALNSSLLALISNNSFRKILHVTQARYSAVVAMSIMPLTITSVAYEAIVKHSLITGNLNCEICAMVRGGLVGAVVGFFYPIILALPLNALLATRYYTAPLPNKDNAVRFWVLLSKPIFKKLRFAALIQVAFGMYLGSKHHEIYLKMLCMPEPGRDPEEIRE